MAVRTEAEARALVQAQGLLALAGTGPLPSLVEAIVGAPVKGSWWGHPRGKLIFNLGEALHDAPDVLVTKLCAGKVTFVHDALWPALYRVVSDAGWRRRVQADLGDGAARLLARVERAGEARLDALGEPLDAPGKKLLAKAKDELEKAVLVQTDQLHTERGSHTTRLRAWASWVSPATERAAGALDFDEALGALRTASRGAPLGLERAVGRARSGAAP